MVVSCLIKEIQITSELKKMAEIDLVSKDVIDSLIKQKFEAPIPKNQDDDDPFIKGEFDVIKELLEKVLALENLFSGSYYLIYSFSAYIQSFLIINFQVPEAVEGKRKVDRIIDICGPTPKGTGLQNLRECIIETKWKYDVAPEEKQVVWKRMILNFMERYENIVDD